MDESDLKIVETLSCVRCGAPCEAAHMGDLVEFVCAADGQRHLLTVRAPDEVPANPEGDPLVGRALGPCRIVRPLGFEGGLPLYQGLDTALNLPRTVRVLHGEAAKDRARLSRFVAAGKLAAAARHTALANVVHLGRFEGGLFSVSPALEGRPLDQAVHSGKTLGVRETLRVARVLAEGLAAMHGAGIVHRNIGPKSVYLLPSGDPQLRNFAFAVRAGEAPGEAIVGQAGYLAPEQAAVRAVDARADLYAFGALLYLALAGMAPFRGSDLSDTLRVQLSGQMPDRRPLVSDGDERLADLILGLLAPEPAARPASARAVLDALAGAEAALRAAEAPAPPAAAPASLVSMALGEDQLAIVEPEAPAAPGRSSAPLAGAGQEPPARELPVRPMPRPKPAPVRKKATPKAEMRTLPALEFGPQPPRERASAPAGPKAPAERPREPSPEPAGTLNDLVLSTDGAHGAGSGQADEALWVEPAEPWHKRRSTLLAAGGIAAAILAVVLYTQVLSPSSPPPPAPKPGPQPTADKKAQPPKPDAAAKLEAAAKAELRKLETAVAKTGARNPQAVLDLCDAFLKDFGQTSSAAAAAGIRKDALAKLRDVEAKTKLSAAQRALGEVKRPLAERLAAADEFIKTYEGTESAKKLAEERVKAVQRADADAQTAYQRVRADADRFLEKKDYGEALKKLEPIAADHPGTQAGEKAAAEVKTLRQQVTAAFEERKQAVQNLLRACDFGGAAAQMEEPLTLWHVPDLQTQGEALAAQIGETRQKVVAGYARLLGELDPLLAECKFEEALALARRPVEPELEALAAGKAADAELLLRALDVAVAGAKAAAAKAAASGEKIWVQQASGVRLQSTIKDPTRKGLVVDMPGLSGEVPWGRLSRVQLLAFAAAAENPTAADRVGLGLLALLGEEIGLAYAEFDKALALDAGARQAVVDCLRRNAAGLVCVPGGDFPAGTNKQPRTLDAYFLGAHEVSNVEYAFFLKATSAQAPPSWADGTYPRGADEHPVTDITWGEAGAYAKWLGMRLPTDIEWERAARGTEGRLYPWGDKFDRRYANIKPATGHTGKVALDAVTRRPIRRDTFPFLHLVGNAREWTSTPVSARPGEDVYYVVGGSANDIEKAAMATERGRQKTDARDPYTGFRLAWPR